MSVFHPWPSWRSTRRSPSFSLNSLCVLALLLQVHVCVLLLFCPHATDGLTWDGAAFFASPRAYFSTTTTKLNVTFVAGPANDFTPDTPANEMKWKYEGESLTVTYFFGGQVIINPVTQALAATNEIVALIASSSSLRFLNIPVRDSTAPAPAPRYAHAAANFWNGFIVHGGFDGTTAFNDLWHFHHRQLQWTQLVPTVLPPSTASAVSSLAFFEHAFAKIHVGPTNLVALTFHPTMYRDVTIAESVPSASAVAFIHGGIGGLASNRTFQLIFFPSKPYVPVLTELVLPGAPSLRLHTGFFSPAGVFCIVFGIDAAGLFHNDIYCLGPIPGIQVVPAAPSFMRIALSSTSYIPEARGGASCSQTDDLRLLYCYGGMGAAMIAQSDLLVLTITTWTWTLLSSLPSTDGRLMGGLFLQSNWSEIWIAYGSSTALFPLPDIKMYSLTTGTWTQPSIAPSVLAPLGYNQQTHSAFTSNAVSVNGDPSLVSPVVISHTMERIGVQHFLFFGSDLLYSQFRNDVYIFDESIFQWTAHLTPPNSSTPWPPGRSNHGSVVYNSTQVYIFAGQSNNSFGLLNDLWRFDSITLSWTEVIYDMSCQTPSPRVLAVFQIDENGTLITFGGAVNLITGKVVNELWVFDTNIVSNPLQCWQQLEPIGQWPTPRQTSTGFGGAYLQGQLYVVNGYNNGNTIQDISVYNFANNKWVIHSTANNRGLFFNTVTLTSTKQFLFTFGSTAIANIPDIYIVSPNNLTNWMSLDPPLLQGTPAPRSSQTTVQSGIHPNHFLIFGGIDDTNVHVLALDQLRVLAQPSNASPVDPSLSALHSFADDISCLLDNRVPCATLDGAISGSQLQNVGYAAYQLLSDFATDSAGNETAVIHMLPVIITSPVCIYASSVQSYVNPSTPPESLSFHSSSDIISELLNASMDAVTQQSNDTLENARGSLTAWTAGDVGSWTGIGVDCGGKQCFTVQGTTASFNGFAVLNAVSSNGALSASGGSLFLNSMAFLNCNNPTAAGGALLMISSNLSCNQCFFANNSAMQLGGAVHAYDSILSLQDAAFAANGVTASDGQGGAIFSLASTLVASDLLCFFNSADRGGCLSSNGLGARYLAISEWSQQFSSTLISSSLFSCNAASSAGAAVFATSADWLSLDSNLFVWNVVPPSSGGVGAGVYVEQSQTSFTGNRFGGNQCSAGCAFYWLPVDVHDAQPQQTASIMMSPNSAKYGELIASNQFQIRLDIPEQLLATSPPGSLTVVWRSGHTLAPAINVTVLDAYGNVVVTDSEDSVYLSASAVFIGETAVVVKNGVASFHDLTLRLLPNSSVTVNFTAVLPRGVVTAPTSLTLLSQPCQPGEYLPPESTDLVCVQCPSGSTSFTFMASQCIAQEDAGSYISWSGGEAIGIVCAILLLLIELLFIASGVVHFRRTNVIRAFSVPFLLVILLGAAMILCSLLAQIGPATSSSCTWWIWLLVLGYAVFMGSFIVKEWRIAKVFHLNSLKILHLSNSTLFSQLSFLVSIDVALLVLLQMVTDYNAHTDIVSGANTFVVHCTTSGTAGTGVVVALYVYNLGFLVYAVCLAVASRNIDSTFSEARYLAFAVYAVAAVSCVIIPMIWLFQTTPAVTITVQAVGIIIAVFGSVNMLFLPKLIRATYDDPPSGTAVHYMGGATPQGMNGYSSATGKFFVNGPNDQYCKHNLQHHHHQHASDPRVAPAGGVTGGAAVALGALGGVNGLMFLRASKLSALYNTSTMNESNLKATSKTAVKSLMKDALRSSSHAEEKKILDNAPRPTQIPLMQFNVPGVVHSAVTEPPSAS